MVKADGLYTPTRAPQGVLSATVYSQAVMAEILDGMIGRWCLAWIDPEVIWVPDGATLVEWIGVVLERFMARELYLAAHKAAFYEPEITWFEQVRSGTATVQDPGQIQGLLDLLRRPSTGDKLVHILKAMNWLH